MSDSDGWAGPRVRGRYDLLAQAETLADKYDWLHQYAIELGFSDTFYGRLAPFEEDGPGTAYRFRRWDPEWVELYERRRFRRLDEAVFLGRRLSRPFVITRPSNDLTAAQTEFYKAAAHFGRLGGVGVPVSHKDGSMAGFSATGPNSPTDRATILELRAAVTAFDDEVGEAVAAKAASQLKVSPRARLWLRCLADGMNHVQAASHLKVTEEAAHKSYSRLRDRFDAGNDVELVLKAASFGLLSDLS